MTLTLNQIQTDQWKELETDSQVYIFWNWLKTQDITLTSTLDQKLAFPEVEPLFGEFEFLFIRKSYQEIWNLIDKNYNLSRGQKIAKDESGKRISRNYLITGSPGIGKSGFLIYLLWKLSQEKDRTVVFTSGKSLFRDTFYLFQDSKVYITIIEPTETLRDRSHWLLLDSRRGKMIPQFPAQTIVASSPDSKRYNQFLKRPLTDKLYMPTWSLEECRFLYSNFYNREIDQVFLERYSFVGGIQSVKTSGY